MTANHLSPVPWRYLSYGNYILRNKNNSHCKWEEDNPKKCGDVWSGAPRTRLSHPKVELFHFVVIRWKPLFALMALYKRNSSHEVPVMRSFDVFLCWEHDGTVKLRVCLTLIWDDTTSAVRILLSCCHNYRSSGPSGAYIPMCLSVNQDITDSVNGLSPVRRLAIIWINAGSL